MRAKYVLRCNNPEYQQDIILNTSLVLTHLIPRGTLGHRYKMSSAFYRKRDLLCQVHQQLAENHCKLSTTSVLQVTRCSAAQLILEVSPQETPWVHLKIFAWECFCEHRDDLFINFFCWQQSVYYFSNNSFPSWSASLNPRTPHLYISKLYFRDCTDDL